MRDDNTFPGDLFGMDRDIPYTKYTKGDKASKAERYKYQPPPPPLSYSRGRFFDASKQGVAAALVHLFNVFFSDYLTNKTSDHDPCTWYAKINEFYFWVVRSKRMLQLYVCC